MVTEYLIWCTTILVGLAIVCITVAYYLRHAADSDTTSHRAYDFKVHAIADDVLPVINKMYQLIEDATSKMSDDVAAVLNRLQSVSAGGWCYSTTDITKPPEFEKLETRLVELMQAATKLYEAGHWTCDRSTTTSVGVRENVLWQNLRNALGRTPGFAPKPIEGNDDECDVRH